MSLSSRELEVFASAVEAGSFGGAARTLLVSQPSVSESIAKLEARVGAQLFVRSARGVTPTPAGEALLPFAQHQQSLLSDALSAVRATAETQRLNIAVHSTFAPRIVPLVLDTIADRPRRLDLRDAHSDEVISLVADGDADAGFIVPHTTPRGIASCRLPDDPICCAVARSHPFGRTRRGRLVDLDGHEIAFNRWGTGADTFADLLSRHHGSAERQRSVADARTAVVLAARHGHVAFVARSAIEVEVETGTLCEVEIADLPSWTVDLDLIYRTNTTDDAVQGLAAAVRALR